MDCSEINAAGGGGAGKTLLCCKEPTQEMAAERQL